MTGEGRAQTEHVVAERELVVHGRAIDQLVPARHVPERIQKAARRLVRQRAARARDVVGGELRIGVAREHDGQLHPAARVERAGEISADLAREPHPLLVRQLGAGSALALASRTLGEDLLTGMRQGWFFFGNLIDDIELSLARADLAIAGIYDELVDPKYRRFIPVLRGEYELTKQQVLKVRGASRLLEGEATVQRSILLRNPYIDPMHLVQVDLLKRWRAKGRESTTPASAAASLRRISATSTSSSSPKPRRACAWCASRAAIRSCSVAAARKPWRWCGRAFRFTSCRG